MRLLAHQAKYNQHKGVNIRGAYSVYEFPKKLLIGCVESVELLAAIFPVHGMLLEVVSYLFCLFHLEVDLLGRSLSPEVLVQHHLLHLIAKEFDLGQSLHEALQISQLIGFEALEDMGADKPDVFVVE